MISSSWLSVCSSGCSTGMKGMKGMKGIKEGNAGWPLVSGVERQGPGCPEFFGVAQVDGLRTSDSHEPGTRFCRDFGLAAPAGAVLQRSECTHFKCPVEDPLNLWTIRLEGLS
jgi:hypothetical protein